MSFEYKDEKRNVLAVANIRNRSYFGTIKTLKMAKVITRPINNIILFDYYCHWSI